MTIFTQPIGPRDLARFSGANFANASSCSSGDIVDSHPYHDLSMAVHDSLPSLETADSDYGTDIDDDTWDAAFSQPVCDPKPIPTIAVEDLEEPVLPDDAEPQTHSLRIARIRENLVAALQGLDDISHEQNPRHRSRERRSIQVEYDQTNRDSFSPVQLQTEEQRPERSPTPQVEPIATEGRTPLERFRTAPKKPLSVTDIVSPAWCELQYWYSLTKYGRIRRTPAMKQGSKIHKEKEQEVHTEVPIQISTKEDRVGLRLWNIIQGLRTLRATGLTRELEVLGVVEGEVVVGIIDEVSYQCPDEEMEEAILQATEAKKGDGKGKEALPADQRTMTDFFGGSQAGPSVMATSAGWLQTLHEKPKTLYLVDIKTRGSKSLPKIGSAMRPTQMQLMLYRRLLNDLAANNVEADRIFSRYSVDSHKPFSDTFIAELGGINFQASQLSDHDDEPPMLEEEDPLDEILNHNTLSSLWAHMIAEFTRTISITAVSSSISPLLTAEFRASKDGALMGRRSFAYDEEVVGKYLQDELQWWRGERETKGVDVEEAYKCGTCEFAENCSWRATKVEEATSKARAKNAARGKTKSSI